MPSRIAKTFADLRAQDRLAFMPFITAGDPDLKSTQQAIRTLAAAKVDLIEIGFPYSDPIADGPVIQASYARALSRQVKVAEIFATIGELEHESLPPLVAMVSYAMIYRHGVEQFLQHAAKAGFCGLIVPDLPGAEAGELFTAARAAGLDLIQLIAPTTPRPRVKQILNAGSGFVYIVAVAGTTGERQNVSTAVVEQLEWLREETELPLAVGFGISRPEHVAPLRGRAQGVIVGTAMVRYLERLNENSADGSTILQELQDFASQMALAAHDSSNSSSG